MNYCGLLKSSMSDGEGLRVALYVSGCTHGCIGCHNVDTWGFDSGREFTEDVLQEVMEAVGESYISGLTITGGDPLHPNNAPTTGKIVEKMNFLFPEKNIWIYTGYKYKDVKKAYDFINDVDVVVDGRYEKKSKDGDLSYRGSSNQKIIRKKRAQAKRKRDKYTERRRDRYGA